MLKASKNLAATENGVAVSIINVVHSLVENAATLRASDIHVEPVADEVRVRFRVDGVLQEGGTLPKEIHSEIISRIKVMAGLRTDEHQAAQDGRFREIIEGAGPIDIRVSIAPAYYGENAVLRLLSDKAEQFSLDTLGFSEPDRDKITQAIHRPYGMILATGPTGSGKTTTLYTILKSLHKPDVSIVTIEDPIEYAIPGIKQMQVNSQTALSFANGLRSILRQDPNIIMVGEIRDRETAGLAVNTALTGHLLLSTLHTNDSVTALPRLLDMGIEPFLVASTVNVVIAQRLVRKICEKCKTVRKFSKEEKDRFGAALSQLGISDEKLFAGKGCENCGRTGYKGRICIAEVLEVANPIREAILRKDPSAVLKDIAVGGGMTTMISDGAAKVRSGLTTIEEVLRVIYE